MTPIFKVEVLVDKLKGDLSIQTTDDVDGKSAEVTLTVEEAWVLVVALNSAIYQLTPDKVHKPKKAVTLVPVLNHLDTAPKPEQVQAAVLESIGADNLRPRHLPPGSPSTKPISGLRKRDIYE